MGNLFKLVMEAEGDLLEPFVPEEDPDPSTSGGEQGAGGQPPADMGADMPPSADQEMEDLSFDDTGGGTEDEANPENQEGEEGQQPGPSLAKQANDVLNQQLYQHMCDQNEAIEDVLEQLQSIIPALPYDVVVQNDKSIQRLKRALEASQDYVLNDFVNSGYGENLLKSSEFDALFAALQNEIDGVLKKHFKDSE